MVARILIKTHPFEKIGVSLVCMRWTLVNSLTGCKRLRLASDLPAVKQQAGWNRLNLPNGAESTCLERPGRVEPQEENPPCGSTFSDHPMDNLTSQRYLLNIEVLQILRPLRSAAHEDNPLSLCLFFQAASGLVCESWLTEVCKTFPVLERDRQTSWDNEFLYVWIQENRRMLPYGLFYKNVPYPPSNHIPPTCLYRKGKHAARFPLWKTIS